MLTHTTPLEDLRQLSTEVCEFCGAHARLVAQLSADPDQRVCAECHRDPRIPTENLSDDPGEET